LAEGDRLEEVGLEEVAVQRLAVALAAVEGAQNLAASAVVVVRRCWAWVEAAVSHFLAWVEVVGLTCSASAAAAV
jgi:hypothetical protein